MKRKMTPKLFARSKIAPSPDQFLEQHWDWLCSHQFIAPLLTAYSNKEIDPTITINACREALLTHEIRVQIADAQESLKKSIARVGADNYTITIYCKWLNPATDTWDLKIGTVERKRIVEDANGVKQSFTEEDDMVYSSRLFQTAERLACLRLARREDSMFAEIVNAFGPPITTTITRDQALGVIFPKDKSPFMKRTPTGESKPFRNYMRVRNDNASFSRG